ncbi:hypothetical protein [Prevotella denticola]|nr:hypothetical protein [Prevotella denticola]
MAVSEITFIVLLLFRRSDSAFSLKEHKKAVQLEEKAERAV